MNQTIELTGRVVRPGDADYPSASAGWNLLFTHKPMAIVFARETQDVVNALNWARQNDVSVRVRSGRHCLEGWSNVDGGIVIDVSDMKSVTVDTASGTATVGAGLNHAAPEGALPVPTATSVAAEGGPADPDLLVAGYLRRLLAQVGAFEAAGGDPDASGLRRALLAVSDTVGRAVRVTLPGGVVLEGTAVDVDADGRIVVDTGPISGRTAIGAGDVEHLRYE